MTLVEMLLAIAMLLVLSTSLLYLLVSVKRTWQAGVARAAVRQDLQTTLWQMATELRDSEAGLVTDGTQSSPLALCFPSATDAQNAFITDSGGGLVWQKFVIYYIPTGTTRLLRKEVYQVPSTPPVQLTQAAMGTYCDGTGSLVCPQVQGVTLAVDGANGGVTLGLTLGGRSTHGTDEKTSASMYIQMRN